jgi:peptidoglycan/xylan/chitin deacetylase (PgdA/CDA1 family)
MNAAIKSAALSAFAALGTQRFLHRTLFRNQLTIVTYHAVIRTPLALPQASFLDGELFRQQVQYLKKHFEVVPLMEAIRKLQENSVERPTAAITFDDGFQNNFDIAFTILREEGLPATIFLTTGLIDTDDTTWFCRLHDALARSSKQSLEWDGQLFDLSGMAARMKALAAVKERLKRLPNSQMVPQNRRIICGLGDDPDRPVAPDSPFRMLSRAAIKEMLDSALVDFGAHTHSHAIVSRLRPAERREEIERSVDVIKELTGRDCELFAYPNGGPEDYDQESIRTLKSCGIRAALTGISGPNNSSTPLMEMRRYAVVAEKSMAHFKLIMHHFAFYLRGSGEGEHRRIAVAGPS